MSQSTRISGTTVDIDLELVREFFEERGRRFSPSNPLVSVLYQDHNPDLARARDEYERKLVQPMLRLDGSQALLDLGCGIGRWAGAIEDRIAHYTGVDVSSELLAVARQSIRGQHTRFLQCSVEDLLDSPAADRRYDRVLAAGLFLYMNDEQVGRSLAAIDQLTNASALIYLREPLAEMERLTLAGHWSEELNQRYHAIYRTRRDLERLIAASLTHPRYESCNFQPLFARDGLENRTETRQYYAILSKLRC